MSGVYWEPKDAASRIAAAGARAMERQAERERVTLDDTIVSVAVSGQPVGEDPACTHGIFDGRDQDGGEHLLAVMCARAQIVAEALGIPLSLTVDLERMRR